MAVSGNGAGGVARKRSAGWREGLAAAIERREGQAYKWIVCGVTTMGSFMSLLDTTSVNIALPPIMANFGTDLETGQWVLTGYMLALAVVMPTTGYLAERLGSKRQYLLVLTAFTVCSLLCGLAWSIESLIFFRILEGLAGGMLQPLGMSIVLGVIRVEERGEFMGVLALPTLLAPILGPTLGGYLTQQISWRAIFTMNVPIGIIAVFCAFVVLPYEAPRHNLTFDRIGFLLSTAGFATTLLGFANGPHEGWTSPIVVGLLSCGLSCLAIWVIYEINVKDPLLDLRLFANPVYSASVGMMFIMMLSLFGFTFLMPIFLQRIRGLDPLQAGLIIFPQALASFVSMNVSGRLYNRLGPRPLIMIGLSILSLATWRMSYIDIDTSDLTITAILLVRGFSMGFLMMPLQTTALNAVPRERMARGTALTNVSQRLFGSFVTALLATIIQTRETFHYNVLSERVTAASLPATQFLDKLQSQFIHMGMTTAQAHRTALQALSRETSQMAGVLSFEDAFRFMFFACLTGFVLGQLIPRMKEVHRVALTSGQAIRPAAPAAEPAPAAAAAAADD